jgi:hypothetical protein
MARSESSVVWTIVAIVGTVLLAAAVLFGPRLWREGRALVGPIAELSRAEGEAKKLNEEFPFQAPEDGRLEPDRVDVFLQIRRELVPHYERWIEVERRVEGGSNPESWEGAKEILAVTRDVVQLQAETLRARAMSPVEFRWLERRVFEQWFEVVQGQSGHQVEAGGLVETTEDDLEFVRGLEASHGRSRALAEVRQRLEGRLAELTDPACPEVEGYSEADAGLLWERRAVIAELTLERYSTIHSALREPGSGGINVQVQTGD